MRLRDVITTAALLAGEAAFAQAPANAPAPATSASAWSYSASAYAYFVPDDRDYVQPTIAADRGRLHFEARYNYEDLETFSAWVGWNLSAGDALSLEFTPMIAGVLGNTTGFAPGFEGSLSWKTLELYSEGEYMLDSEDTSDDFFYNWSQLTLAPVNGIRFGLVTQRTRAYESKRETQRGVLAGYTRNGAEASLIVFNPDDGQPIVVAMLGLAF